MRQVHGAPGRARAHQCGAPTGCRSGDGADHRQASRLPAFVVAGVAAVAPIVRQVASVHGRSVPGTLEHALVEAAVAEQRIGADAGERGEHLSFGRCSCSAPRVCCPHGAPLNSGVGRARLPVQGAPTTAA